MPRKLYPYTTLAVLTGLSILNYIDRNMLLGLQPLVQKEFKINDAQTGLLTSAFFFCYMIAAPLLGWMGDRFSRKNIVLIGIAVWSGFTLLTWLVRDYNQLLFRHTIVGIGEASYATIAPSLVADLFPVERRGRMLSIFYLGLPLGSALGILLGGPLGEHYGWRVPFMMAGIPGFALALIFWLLPEPERGRTETLAVSPERSTFVGLFRNGAFITACLGMAMYTFAVGGLQVWIPTFLHRVRGMSVSRAAITFGLIAAVNGIVATILGGWIGDRMLKRHDGGYYRFSGMTMFAAVPLMIAAVYVTGPLMLPSIFFAVFALLIGTGPSNAAVVNSVNAGIRSTALAVNTFVIHALGDAFSPTLIGWVSDRTSLQTSFWSAFVAAGLSGWLFWYGARYAPKLKPTANETGSSG
ncbi:MAG TPA: MFS transporter [Candidatus Angelobacter sp.]|nr:MFS transporter [Candidatus Angelobacter sp.]